MVSLAGVPPTGGFWGKLLIFRVAIERGGWIGPVLAAIMVINSVISVGYYFLIPRAMIFEEPLDEEAPRASTPVLLGVVVTVALAAIVVIFILPNAVYRLGELSAAAFGG
jgi:NADH:ubiquinone oxidoreductase subunit 2 (subunit N)